MSRPSLRRSELADALGPRMYAWLAVIGLGLLTGLYGVVSVLTQGTVVLGISSQLPWGILISTYEFFLLTSAGVMIGVIALSVVFGVGRFDLVVKRGVLLALATLGAGLFTIVIGLGRPERPIVHALLNANVTSPIWWVIMFAGSFGAALVALLFVLESDRFSSPRLALAVGSVGLLVGVAVAVAAGMIFGTAQARPYYGGPLAPLYFVLTGTLSGVAALGFVVVAEHKATGTPIGGDLRELITGSVAPVLGVLVAAALLTAAVKAIYGLTSTSDSTAMAYEHMLFGSFGPLYWGLGILVGLLIPLALMAYPKTRTPNGVLAASGMALVGLFVTRYEFVVGGQVVALTADPGHEYPLVSYAPSVAEATLVVFALALCALIYTVGSVLFDLDELPPRNGDTRMNAPTARTGGTDDD